MTYRIPINQCLALAERRISDAAEAHASWRRSDPGLVDDLQRQARDFLAEAAAQGWVGDADAVIVAWWKIYR